MIFIEPHQVRKYGMCGVIYLGAEELTVDTTDCLVNSGKSSSDLWIGSSIMVPVFCLWNSESICVFVLSGCSGAPLELPSCGATLSPKKIIILHF